ncbi:MAG TPA: hypothetical protein HA252_06380, partial [Candidatus Diapherotrites archaeon]|nr:hypothetical protein [Candidatus Diapherotrites archaeon]
PAEEAVHTVEIPGSTPVQNGVIEVFDKSNDFKRLNVDRRGTILEVSRGAINQITYSPSKATPLILKMTNRNDEAWAFYSLAIGGNAANLGPVSSKWNGIGYSCSSFDDRRMIEAFYETPDQHGLETKCALLGGEIAATSYGFEFCKPLDYGNVYLKTIYYTPQNQESKIHLNVGNDKASFIAQAGGGSDALLYGVPEVSSLLDGHQVESIGDVLKLVAKQFVCISGTDARADFWWNPKKVSDTDFMKAEELAITTATTPEKACIESK